MLSCAAFNTSWPEMGSPLKFPIQNHVLLDDLASHHILRDNPRENLNIRPHELAEIILESVEHTSDVARPST